jgi:hypothetical protein
VRAFGSSPFLVLVASVVPTRTQQRPKCFAGGLCWLLFAPPTAHPPAYPTCCCYSSSPNAIDLNFQPGRDLSSLHCPRARNGVIAGRLVIIVSTRARLLLRRYPATAESRHQLNKDQQQHDLTDFTPRQNLSALLSSDSCTLFSSDSSTSQLT